MNLPVESDLKNHEIVSFGLDDKEYGLITEGYDTYLAVSGNNRSLNVRN